MLVKAYHLMQLGLWIHVPGMSGPNEYTIHQLSEECSENCGMRCKECNICVHLYSCSCPDSILQHTICKHLHLVARYRKQDELPNVQDTLDDMLMEEITTASTRNCESVKNRIMVLLNMQFIRYTHRATKLQSIKWLNVPQRRGLCNYEN